jgi:predicted nucleic acid-binding protein
MGPRASIGRQHGVAVYDAAYLELAQRRELPIATIDVCQRDLASALGIPVVTVE